MNGISATSNRLAGRTVPLVPVFPVSIPFMVNRILQKQEKMATEQKTDGPGREAKAGVGDRIRSHCPVSFQTLERNGIILSQFCRIESRRSAGTIAESVAALR